MVVMRGSGYRRSLRCCRSRWRPSSVLGLGLWMMVVMVVVVGRSTTTTTAAAQFCAAGAGDVEEAERTIYHDKHEHIAYVGTKPDTLKSKEDLQLRYNKRMVMNGGIDKNNDHGDRFHPNSNFNEDEDEMEMVDGVPQYFTDLRDRDVERELKYRVQHGRWSDRVILEKLYFGLIFGKSGFPDHYYLEFDDDDDSEDVSDEDNDSPPSSSKLEKADGWEIFDRDESYCEWTGITCHDNKVTEIRLENYELKGTLTDDIQYLSDLDYLDFQGNNLGGTIPTTMSALNNLRVLNLAINNFTSTIPRQSLRLRNLEKLFLSNNAVTGTLPKALLDNLPKLTMLDFAKNNLTGSIPQNYGTGVDRKLIYMYLESNKLTGKLPEDASGLPSLQVLEATGNQLSGTIPTSWMALTKLESFSLGKNLLTGTIPTELLNLSDLTVLVLSENKMSGKIPTGDEGPADPTTFEGDNESVPKNRTWSNLSKLHVVLLNNNRFSGTLPSAFIEASAPFLMNLDLANNTFTGTFPRSIGKLKNLKRFHAQLNKFAGTLPASISHLSPFLDLNLTGNLLVGSVPGTFCGSGARSKSTLFRQFGCDAILCPPGTFHPSGAATMESACRPCHPSDEDEDYDPPLNRILGRLDCPGTEFVHGDLDGDGELSQSEILRLLWTYTVGRNWGAQFQSWADPQSNVCELNGITCVNDKIAKIDLTDAAMCSDSTRKVLRECYGLPAELSLLTDLEILTMNQRQYLHSTIPSEFGRLTKLKYLDIGASPNMVGTLPSELGRMTSMKILNFAGCRFTGTVPEEFYQMTNLEKLHLSMNALTGTLSSQISKLTNLKELMWSRSQLTGSIPNELGNVTSLENWELYGNQLTGTIPSSLGNCSNLKRIDLFNNKLEGPIPESLTNLSSLQILHIKLNNLTGTIPAGFGDLPFLSWFDVSSNRLHGTIPATFGSSRSIKDFRLASNMIHDPIPQSLCTNTNINGGLTRIYGCDGVICPLGTYSAPGHATHSEGCKPCPEGGTTIYLGGTSCDYLNDADILAIYYNVMGGSAVNAVQKNHWGDPEGADPCGWNGIKCDEEGDVVSIRFPLMGLEDSDYL